MNGEEAKSEVRTIVGGAVRDLERHLLAGDPITVGQGESETPLRERVQSWAQERGLDLDKAPLDWHEALTPERPG
jgi:hypothetical protein